MMEGKITIKILFYLYLLLSLCFTFHNKKNLLYFYVFSLPFFGLMFDVGLQVDISKILSFFMMLLILSGLVKLPKAIFPTLFFLIYVILTAIILSLFLPDTAKDFPPLRGEYRWIFQIIMWFLMFAPFFYSQFFNREIKEIERLYKIYLVSLVFCVFLGFIQVIIYYFTGNDIFPIAILYGEDYYRAGIFGIYDKMIFRMSSLGGEPKHLAYSIVIGLIILFSHLFNSKFIFSKKLDLFFIFIICIGLLLTLSTQGYFLFVLNMVVLIIMTKKIKLINLFLFSALFLAVDFIVNNILGFSFKDLFYYKILRGEQFLLLNYIEDWNVAVLGFLCEHPTWLLTGVGIGNIHLWAQDYIPDYATYMIDNVFVAKSGLLRLLSEVGIIGACLFFYAFLKAFAFYRKENKMHYMISLLIIVDFIFSSDGPVYFPFAFIIVYNLYRNYFCKKINEVKGSAV